jgi:gliding motility-associated lipoprotein GldH
MDTLGNVFEKKLVSEFLFDKKTGKPFGNSVLGDIYDHRIPILKKYVFKNPGRYVMRYEHFMRTDSLAGILGVGLRIEKSNP